MIRILVIIAVIALFFALRWFQKSPPEEVARILKILALTLAGCIILYLGVTGRLNWILAAIGVVFAFIFRMLPLLVRMFPELHKLWVLIRGAKQTSSNQSGAKNYASAMSLDEAYSLLGLNPGATKQQIIAAHKKLMQKNHPDRGGTDYLASKINLAKKILLKHLD